MPPIDEPDWDNIQTRERSNAIIYQSMLWCPSIDTDAKSMGQSALRGFKKTMSPTILEGGKGQLRSFEPTMKLYILAHGNEFVPVFQTDKSWNAEQLADLLVSDGLNLKQGEIELLVCHAGESVNTVKKGAALMKIRDAFKAAESKGLTSKAAELKNEFKESAKYSPPTKFFESDPENLLLPLAAQFTQALKDRHFSNFRVTSYKAPVAVLFDGGVIHLDLKWKGGKWGESIDAKDNCKYRVVWQ